MPDLNDLSSPSAESGVIATLLFHPDYLYHADDLSPQDFADSANASLFWAEKELIHRGVTTIDDYQLYSMLTSAEASEQRVMRIELKTIQDITSLASCICRESPQAYMELVKELQDYRSRRELYSGAQRLKSACTDKKMTSQMLQTMAFDIAEKHSMMSSRAEPLETFAVKSKSLWQRIMDRQNGTIKSVPLPIPALQPYVSLEIGELVCIAGVAKAGKSSFLLTCCVDLLKRGEGVVYFDSELSDSLFYMRMLAHVSGVPFIKVRDGNGTPEEKARILKAKEWIESVNLIHEYTPSISIDTVSSVYHRAKTKMKVTVVIWDYFKANFSYLGSENAAYSTAVGLTGLIDSCKRLVGEEKLMGIGALQLQDSGKVSFSASAVQTLSTLISILRKTPQEIQADGRECGNMKAFIGYNRNGPQMTEGEYIDLQFDGDFLTYRQADRQHEAEAPY